MMQVLLIFLAQFILIFLLGFQSRCVRDSQYLLAVLNSFGLGISGLIITPLIATPDLIRESPAVLVAYLLAGPLAISTAIWLHDRSVNNKKT